MQEYYEIKTKQGVMRGFFHKPDGNQYPVCFMALQVKIQEQNFLMYNYQE